MLSMFHPISSAATVYSAATEKTWAIAPQSAKQPKGLLYARARKHHKRQL